jgi:hypothetical protein
MIGQPNINYTGAVILFLWLLWLLWIFGSIFLASVPAFVVGRRRGVRAPWLAFVPFVGASIVILRSIGRSGWRCVLLLIPIVGLVFGIWLVFVVPSEHGRTKWWALPFLVPVVQLGAFYIYAFTLPRTAASLNLD